MTKNLGDSPSFMEFQQFIFLVRQITSLLIPGPVMMRNTMTIEKYPGISNLLFP